MREDCIWCNKLLNTTENSSTSFILTRNLPHWIGSCGHLPTNNGQMLQFSILLHFLLRYGKCCFKFVHHSNRRAVMMYPTQTSAISVYANTLNKFPTDRKNHDAVWEKGCISSNPVPVVTPYTMDVLASFTPSCNALSRSFDLLYTV